MVVMKRKRPGDEYDEDEKLLHQATKTLTKEAKRVRTFLLQQAIRKSKMVTEKAEARKNGGQPAPDSSADLEGTPDVNDAEDGAGTVETGAGRGASATAAGTDMSPLAREIAMIKALNPEVPVKICLRRLGLAHTGPAGEKEAEVEGPSRLKKLVGQIVAHKRVTTVMDDLQERVTNRRRAKLAEMEGRSLPRQGRAAKGGRGEKGRPGERSGRQGDKRKTQNNARAPATAGSTGSAFVSLSGEAPSDEEWASAAQSRPNKNASYGPGSGKISSGDGNSAERTHQPGWAGADRAAGWGRGGGGGRGGYGGPRNGGGRSGRGKGRQSEAFGGGRRGGHPDNRQAGTGRGGRGERGRGRGASLSQEGRGGRGEGGLGEQGRGGAGEAGGEVEVAGRLHGSWAAKRALKEKEKSATKAFSGTRIQFDDDD